MEHWLVGALLAALAGVLISAGNYALSRRIMEKKPGLLAAMSIPRQLVNVVYFVALYLLSSVTPWGVAELLIGGAVGLTGAMFYFTGKLLKPVKPGKENGGDENG